MGAVYLAVRDDDEDKRRVAIKLLRPRMTSDDLVRRFRNERQILGGEHPDVAATMDELANSLQHKGQYEAAERMYRESRAIHRKALGDEHPDVAQCLNNPGMLLYRKGDYESAESLYREALVVDRKALGTEHQEVAIALLNLARAIQAQGAVEKAEPPTSKPAGM